jgi:hypothetical protein
MGVGLRREFLHYLTCLHDCTRRIEPGHPASLSIGTRVAARISSLDMPFVSHLPGEYISWNKKHMVLGRWR